MVITLFANYNREFDLCKTSQTTLPMEVDSTTHIYLVYKEVFLLLLEQGTAIGYKSSYSKFTDDIELQVARAGVFWWPHCLERWAVRLPIVREWME